MSNPIIISGDTPVSAFKTITPNCDSQNNHINLDVANHLPPLIVQILEKHTNVALAGGSLVSILSGMKLSSTQDYDLFILGGENWDTIRDIISMANGTKVTIGRGVINILGASCERPIQLIIANNANVQDLLKKFDIGLCMIAYCNSQLYMDELAYFGLTYRVVPITNIYATTTARFAKYINRGFGIATTYDHPITRINNLTINYTIINETVMILNANLHDCEVIDRTMCPYAHCVHDIHWLNADPTVKPFILYMSVIDYIPDVNYEEITLLDYINMFGIDYEVDQSAVNIDDIYAKMISVPVTSINSKITRPFVESLIDAFYKNLDKKIGFWLDTFVFTMIPVSIE